MITIHKNEDGLFALFDNDTGVSEFIRRGKRYQPWILEVAKKYIQPDTDVLDIGAHLGSFTIPFARLADRVYAFEPHPILLKQLDTNIFLNNIHNVMACGFALGDIRKIVQIEIPNLGKHFWKEKGNYGGAKILPLKEPTEKHFCTEMYRLDDLVFRKVSFIKIDAQFSELEILKGAKNLIKKNKPAMVIEMCKRNAKEEQEFFEIVKYMTVTHSYYKHSHIDHKDWLWTV